MSRRKYTEVPEVVECRCWVGRYQGGSLGWLMPRFLDRPGTALDRKQKMSVGLLPNTVRYVRADMYRVKVTLEPVLNKWGRPIMRRARKP